MSPKSERAKETLLQLILQQLSKSMRHDLSRPLTLNELKEACLKMAKQKSPGPDGIVVELLKEYLEFWVRTLAQWYSHLLPKEAFLKV